MRNVLGVFFVALCVAACGSSSSSSSAEAWKSLHTVRITVAQPSLPPPYGEPKTTAFTTPAQVARVTAALNAHHIAKAASSSTNNGCTGGHTVMITITPQSGAATQLSAYRCANQTTGDIDGDLTGFLSSLGIPI
jgi:hypothetical protein